MLGILMLAMIWIGRAGAYDHTQSSFIHIYIEIIYVVGTIFFGALGASLFCANMTSNSERLNELMLPASTTEKYLSRFLICVLGTNIVFALCFIFANECRILISDAFGWMNESANPFEVFCDRDMPKLMLILITTQATFVLGSTVWPKNSFQKTFAFIWIFYVVVICLLSFITKPYIVLPGNSWSVNTTKIYDFTTAFCYIGSAIWTLFCYITAYFRMRESEIINRY